MPGDFGELTVNIDLGINFLAGGTFYFNSNDTLSYVQLLRQLWKMHIALYSPCQTHASNLSSMASSWTSLWLIVEKGHWKRIARLLFRTCSTRKTRKPRKTRKIRKRGQQVKWGKHSQLASFWERPVENACKAVVQDGEHQENVVQQGQHHLKRV